MPREGDDDWAYTYPYTGKMPGIGVCPFINDRATAERYLLKQQPAAYRPHGLDPSSSPCVCLALLLF